MSTIPDMLVQIKNAQAIGREEVVLPFSGMKLAVANVLQKEGFVGEVEKIKRKMHTAEVPFLRLTLVYKDGQAAIHGVKLVSKSSRRVYAGKNELPAVKSNLGASVISTSKGIMTGREARKAGLGGELLFEIW